MATPTSLTDREMQKFDSHNNVRVSNIDSLGRVGFNSIFGDTIIGTRVPSIAAQFQYPLEDDDTNSGVVNGGVITIEDAMLKLKTDAQANSYAWIESKEYVRYIPGHESYCFFTIVLSDHQNERSECAGVFDSENGFFLKHYSGGLYFVRRRDSVDEEIEIDVPNVYPGFNPHLGNVYAIRYGYLGFANSILAVLSPKDGWVKMAEFEYPNSSLLTHIAQTNLPVRAEIDNVTSTESGEIAIGSVSAGIVDGGGADPSSRPFSLSNSFTISVGDNSPIIFRNKTTYAGVNNKIRGVLTLISSATEGNKPVTFKIIKNITVTNTPTWQDVDTANSTHEYATDATVTFGTGRQSLAWDMAKIDTFFENVEDQIVYLYPGETATIVISSAGAADVNLSLRWKELF